MTNMQDILLSGSVGGAHKSVENEPNVTYEVLGRHGPRRLLACIDLCGSP